MNIKMMGHNLNRAERAIIENLADHMEGVARNLPSDAVVYDQGNNEVSVKDMLFREAWDLKQVARFGTPSYRI